jgi:hypothetical protein
MSNLLVSIHVNQYMVHIIEMSSLLVSSCQTTMVNSNDLHHYNLMSCSVKLLIHNEIILLPPWSLLPKRGRKMVPADMLAPLFTIPSDRK